MFEIVSEMLDFVKKIKILTNYHAHIVQDILSYVLNVWYN